MTSSHPTEITTPHWMTLVGCLITLMTADSLYTGTLEAIPSTLSDVTLTNVTRTRTSGSHAGTTHSINRRRINLLTVDHVTSLGLAA